MNKEINGHTLHTLIHTQTGIEYKHLRITRGYKEIQPTSDSIGCKQGDKLEVKLRILGGGRNSNDYTHAENKGNSLSMNRGTNIFSVTPYELMET